MPRPQTVKSTCCYCGVGCGIQVTKSLDGKLSVKGNEDYPVNKGMLCSKGMNLHYATQDYSDRLLHPMMRGNKSQPLSNVSWEQALTRAAATFKTIQNKYGPDSVGFYVSGQLLTEEYYIVNKLTKGFLKTNNIDTNSRLCMSSAVVGYKKALGEDSVPVSYEDLEIADTFLVAGANPAWCHPILWRRIEAHKEANPNVKIVVVDPRKTQSVALADLHLQIKPGTDITLFHAIGRILIENDWIDPAFISEATEGFENYKSKVFERSVEEAAGICDVPVEDIALAAKYIADAKGYIPMWTMGLNQSVIGTDKNSTLLNLSLITGHIGKPGSGPLSLTGQPNAMGGREVGGLANMLAVHKDYTNPEHRDHVANFWGVQDLSDRPGLPATKMFEALAEGKMKAIWIMCTNPSVSLPNARLVDEALKKAKFVVVQDVSNLSDTVKYADLVLPAAGWTEKDGTMTNSERRVSYLNKITDAPGECLPDAEILWRFAEKMGWKDNFNYSSYSEIYDEHCALTKGTNLDVSGLSHKRLKEEGSFQWPVPSVDSTGTTRLFEDKKFFTPSTKAQIITVESDMNRSEALDEDLPLVLTTGRIRDQWHTMTKTGKVNKLKQHIDKPFLEIHPEDAQAREINDGDVVEIKSRRGEVRVNAKVTPDIKRGVVFLPMHWGKILNKDFGRANNVTNALLDPYSKEPDFKYSAVQVAKFSKPAEKIIIVGAGAAAFRFIQTYRELGSKDELVVFSKEKHTFYNRVLLPEYIIGKDDWSKLLKFREGETDELKVDVKDGVSIEHIDRENKTVTDSEGQVHTYDKLILATGARARRPPNLPKVDGIFTMRERSDADKFMQMMKPDSKVVIVGGGLLGLELAACLSEMNMESVIIQRANRLMERQLDKIGSDLLHQDVSEKDVTVYYNDQVDDHVLTDGKLTHVELQSGVTLECDLLVYSIGTIPNIEFAKEAGLKANRGLIVNEYLQTSDPDVYAMGEIGEFNGMLFGITAAAEQQAQIVARHAMGDTSSTYGGSLLMNILKFRDLNLCSLGYVETPKDVPGIEEVVYVDRGQRYYKKCLIKDDKLIGAILIGDKTEFADFKNLIENEVELADKRANMLIIGDGDVKEVKGELVCACNNVGHGNIVEAINDGNHTLNDIVSCTGAGTGCGSCKPEVKAILDEEMSKQTVEA